MINQQKMTQNLIKPIWYLCHNIMTAIIDQGSLNGTIRLDHPFSKIRIIIWTLYGRNYIDRHVAILYNFAPIISNMLTQQIKIISSTEGMLDPCFV